MIIDYLDIFSIPVVPSEADAPLVVDANAPLATPFTLQGFQPITRWLSKVGHSRCRIDHPQLALGNSDQIGGEASCMLSSP